MNYIRNADKLSVGVTKFVVGSWFVIKLEDRLCCLLKGKIEKKKRNEGGKEKSYLTSYKLNITESTQI